MVKYVAAPCGRQKSITEDQFIAETDVLFDKRFGKSQEQINKELNDRISESAIKVDSELAESANPVQNRVIKKDLEEKDEVINSLRDESSAQKKRIESLQEKVQNLQSQAETGHSYREVTTEKVEVLPSDEVIFVDNEGPIELLETEGLTRDLESYKGKTIIVLFADVVDVNFRLNEVTATDLYACRLVYTKSKVYILNETLIDS